MFICSYCGEVSAINFKRAANSRWWAVGQNDSHAEFRVRAVFPDLLSAQTALRLGEECRCVMLMVEKIKIRRDRSRTKNREHNHSEGDSSR